MSYRPWINAMLIFFSLIAMPFQQATAFIFGEEEISLAFDKSITGGLSLMSNNEMASAYGNYRPYEALLRIYNQHVDTSNLDVHARLYKVKYSWGFEDFITNRAYLVDKILAFEAEKGTNAMTVSIYDRSYKKGELKDKLSKEGMSSADRSRIQNKRLDQAHEKMMEEMKNRHKDDAKDKKWMQSLDKDEIKHWDKELNDKNKGIGEWAQSLASKNSQRKHNHKSPHSSRNKHILNTSGTLIDSKNISSNDISLLRKQLECRMGLCG